MGAGGRRQGAEISKYRRVNFANKTANTGVTVSYLRRGPGLVMNIAGSWVLGALVVCEHGGAGGRADGLRHTCTAEVITHVTTRH